MIREGEGSYFICFDLKDSKSELCFDIVGLNDIWLISWFK